MINRENLEKFAKSQQTDITNVAREYCQHLFLSYLYQQPGCEKMLFKGGTALRVILKSPRFSEDLDFTGKGITENEIEDLFSATMAEIERTGILVDIAESKKTTGGHLGVATFVVQNMKIKIQIEVSFRDGKKLKGTRALIENYFVPPYTIVHLEMEEIISGKLNALRNRAKPRDFYDYYFLLSGTYPSVRDKNTLMWVLEHLRKSKIDFRGELRRFLPASHAMLLRDFRKILEKKILTFNPGK